MQRVAVGLDLVVRDLVARREFHLKAGTGWRMARRAALGALEGLHGLLRALPGGAAAAAAAGVFPRAGVPRPLRCLRDESRRDMRDFIILKNSIRLSRFHNCLLRKFLRQGGC